MKAIIADLKYSKECVEAQLTDLKISLDQTQRSVDRHKQEIETKLTKIKQIDQAIETLEQANRTSSRF